MNLYDQIDAHVGSKHIDRFSAEVSPMGQQRIHEFEGFRSKAYPDPASGGVPWTIGFGTTRYANGAVVRKGDIVSYEEAALAFEHDLDKFTRSVLQAVEVPINQSQLDSLVSLAYNIGKNAFRRSTLLRKLNAGDYQGAADEFPKWRNADGKVMPGLVARRASEREWFLKDM